MIGSTMRRRCAAEILNSEDNGRHSARRVLVLTVGELGHAPGSPVTLERAFSLRRVGVELDKLVAQREAAHLGTVVKM